MLDIVLKFWSDANARAFTDLLQDRGVSYNEVGYTEYHVFNAPHDVIQEGLSLGATDTYADHQDA